MCWRVAPDLRAHTTVWLESVDILTTAAAGGANGVAGKRYGVRFEIYMRGNPTTVHENEILKTLGSARIQTQLGMICDKTGGACFNIKHRTQINEKPARAGIIGEFFFPEFPGFPVFVFAQFCIFQFSLIYFPNMTSLPI